MTEILLMDLEQLGVLESVGDDLFDGPVIPERAREFLADPRHHLVIAKQQDAVVGFGTAIHYVHPDKDPELWIAEVGVLEEYRKRGIAQDLMRRLFALGSELGCGEAWVLTEKPNDPAIRLYESVGGKLEDEPVMFSFQLEGQ